MDYFSTEILDFINERGPQNSQYNPDYWECINYLGKRCAIHVLLTTSNVKQEKRKRIPVVLKNLTRKTLYRYLVNDYIDKGDEPLLSELGITDYNSLMRKLDMAAAVLKITNGGDVYIIGNLVGRKYNFVITFPKGVFVRRKKGVDLPKYETKFMVDRPCYTFLEIEEGYIDVSELDGVIYR